MLNIVGQIASKEDFYKRDREVGAIKKVLAAGANIQLSAPRRVGKSSILYHLKDTPSAGYFFIYIEVESARNIRDFYRKIIQEIFRSGVLTTRKVIWEQFKAGTNRFFARLKGFKVVEAGIEFHESDEVDYEQELLNFLLGIDLGENRLILMIDEFPEVILNIIEDHKGDTNEAKAFLQSNRELRNHPGLLKRVQFIYTGSNSLNVTVSSFGSSSMINDLNAIPIEPLRPENSKDLITQVLTTYGYSIANEQLEYILSKVQWHIPFYFQLVMQEIMRQIEPQTPITTAVIDSSITQVTDRRNDHLFEHYVSRLKRLYKGDNLEFVSLFLNKLAVAGEMSKDGVVNLAHGLVDEVNARQILSSLLYDGYITEVRNKTNIYEFNSPFLKTWWYNHEC